MDALHPTYPTVSSLTDEEQVSQSFAASLSLQAYLDGLVAAPLYNLPVTLTDFIGRQNELEMLRMLLSRQRLVTLVGLGGVGKTRLALQIADDMRMSFADGVCFTPLASVAAPEFLIPALVEAVQLPTAPGADLKGRLLDYLRNKELLLVLDNFEQLIPAAGLLTEILQNAPGVKALATSRERLNLYEEWVFEVGGLRLPEEEATQSAENSDAARLFLQSAQRVCPGFSPTEADQAQVARICRLVDGLPLALELAGAWVRVLSCEEIAAGIEEDLSFLSADWSNVPERHRSMPVVFERSWDLLDERERQIFERLAVFRGGFTKEAAVQVAGAALPDLSTLVTRSFLSRNPERKRYEIHPLLRRYAEDKLTQAPVERDRVGDLHCEYFTAFLHDREETARGKDQRRILQEIGEEIDNIRGAWRWAVQNVQWELLDVGLEGLFHFYDTRSLYAEGADLFGGAAELLNRAAVAPPDVFWRLRFYQAAFVARLRHIDEARRLFEAGLPALRAGGRPADVAFCLNCLGLLLALKGQHAEASQALAEALTIAREQDLPLLAADVLTNQAESDELQGNLAEVGAVITQAGEIYRAQGDLRGEAHSYYLQGWIFVRQGHFLQAQSCFRQSCAIVESLGDLFRQSSCLDALASALRRQGYYSDAAENRCKALTLVQQTGNRQGEGVVLSNLGTDLMNLGDYVAAQTYYRRSLAIYRELGFRRNESADLGNLASLALNAGDPAAALTYIQFALDIAQADGDRFMTGICWVIQADALAAAGQADEAAALYEQVLLLLEALGQTGRVLEARGGLARLTLTQGNRAAAQAQAEHLWQALQATREDVLDSVMELYVACIRVFAAVGDARLPECLHQAHALLQERAAKINDETLRYSFLHNVPSHRQIEAEFASLTGETPAGKGTPAQGNTSVAGLIESLTPQELTIVRLLAEGLTNQQIAERLFITVGTVKFHTHSIYGKLGVENRTGAVARARDLNLL